MNNPYKTPEADIDISTRPAIHYIVVAVLACVFPVIALWIFLGGGIEKMAKKESFTIDIIVELLIQAHIVFWVFLLGFLMFVWVT